MNFFIILRPINTYTISNQLQVALILVYTLKEHHTLSYITGPKWTKSITEQPIGFTVRY